MGDIRTRFTIEGEQQYKSAMTDAANAVKVLNAEQKLAKAQFENTGNAEKYAAQQSDILKRKIDEQKKSVEAARQAMKQLSDNGVAENSRQFQQWQTKLINAQTALTQTETELEKLNGTMQQTSQGTQALVSNLNGISRKISLDQVITGINSITGAMEKAAGKAVELGGVIWNNIMDSAKWADDTATMALMYGIDLDTFQRMQKLVTNGMDTSVDAILTAQSKLNRGIGNGNTNVIKFLKELKIGLREGNLEDPFSWKTKDPAKMFWEVGEALMNMSDAYDKEAAAQALFGRSWRELIPLFTEYKSLDEYNAALAEVNVNSEEDVNALAELNEKVGELKGNLETLSNEVWAHMAPALTSAAEALNGLLTRVLEYLETPEGQQALDDMGKAVEGLFEDLGKIDPEKVVENFATLFNGVVNSFEWLKENWGAVKNALIGIAAGFGVLKIATLAMNIGKVVSGLGGLLSGGNGGGGGGGGGTPTVTGTDTGTTKTGVPWLTRFLNTAVQGTQTSWLMNFAFDQRGKWFGIDTSGTNVETAKQFIEANNIIGEYAEQNLQLAQFIDGLEKETTRKVIPYGTYKKMQKAKDSDTTDHSGRIYFGDVQGFEMGEDVDISTLLDASDGAEEIQEQVGTVEIPVKLSVSGIGGGFFGGTNGKLWESMFDLFNITGHANGLPWVPYDGYLSVLHRGERVLTASENRSYTYNNNNYFGNVNLNNGQDIDALCDRIDRRNRRKQGGFG